MSQVTSSEVKPLSGDDVEAIDRLQQAYRQLVDELGKVIVGQRVTIEQLAIVSSHGVMHC